MQAQLAQIRFLLKLAEDVVADAPLVAEIVVLAIFATIRFPVAPLRTA